MRDLHPRFRLSPPLALRQVPDIAAASVRRASAASPGRRARAWLLAALASLALAAPPRAAGANVGDLYGFGSRGGALCGAVSSLADDHTALFYNPAGMSFGQPGMGVGLGVSLDDVTIRMKMRPSGYDLPNLGSASPAIPSGARLGTRGDVLDIPNNYSFLVGAMGSFGLTRLRVGVAVMLPFNQIGHQRSHFADEREQYFSNNLSWELIGERSEHQTILVGGSWMLLDWVSIGFGMSVMPTAKTDSRVYLADAARQDQVVMTVDNHQTGATGLQAGLVLKPTDALRFGLSYRTENAFSMSIRNEVQVKGFQEDPSSWPLVQNVKVVVNYVPAQANVGVAMQRGALTLAADAAWTAWSQMIGSDGLRGTGFHDTISVRAGAEWISGPSRTLRVGLGWEPSPVPAQTGRTNYVDNDRIRLGVGSSHGLELLGKDVEIGWYAQVHGLLPRDTDKEQLASYPACAPGVTSLCDEIPDDTPNPSTGKPEPAFAGLQTGNPGFPGWQSFGTLLAFGVDVRWRF